jgi:peptide/nickel transport system permease protein
LILRSLAVLLQSVPEFAIGVVVVILPAIWWNWTFNYTYVPLTEDPRANFFQFLPPALVLATGLMTGVLRMTRSQMLEVLQKDYVRTAWAKGLSPKVVMARHALRNALIPVVAIIGLQIAVLLSGAIIIESIFSLPGMGRLLLDALQTRDYPVVQGITLLSGLLVVAANLLVDLSLPILDPRIRRI